MFKKVLSTLLLVFSLVLNSQIGFATTPKPVEYSTVSALEVVNKPSSFINKNVKFTAVFNKFSTIGLDYKPAMRNSKDYISFLIKRDNIKDHTVPLSELKIFIKRDKAEKLIDLETGDKIEVKGKIFANALGDAWMDAYEVTNLEPKKTPKK